MFNVCTNIYYSNHIIDIPNISLDNIIIIGYIIILMDWIFKD